MDIFTTANVEEMNEAYEFFAVQNGDRIQTQIGKDVEFTTRHERKAWGERRCAPYPKEQTDPQ